MEIDFLTGAPVSGDLDVRWIHGSPSRRHRTDPPIQVHAFDEHTYVFRQSKDVTYEAPFLFLLFGNDRALLLDTGATKDDMVRATVDKLMDDWLVHHPHTDYQLVVAHSHGHGDHVAGDETFADRPNTTIVPRDVDAVRAFFEFANWPADVVRFDLGGRVLEMTGIPGHHPASMAVYDPWAGWLLSGDTVYPGRLYVRDFPAFVDSVDRLVGLAEDRPVVAVLGCHIEMTRTPGRDYFTGCRYQPDEPALEMTIEQLRRVRDAAATVASKRGVHRYDDFIIYNGMGFTTQVRLIARSLSSSALAALRPRRP
jgi:glyoxylase-like metal-dependent hydrolase (beta-lactamase superfamily II)